MTLTDILAAYGALLSTIISLWEVGRARPRIRPRMIAGVRYVNGELTSGAHLSIQNVSNHAVHLAHVALLYRHRRAGVVERIRHTLRFRTWPRHVGWVHSSLANFGLTDRCPVALEPRRSHDVFIPDAALRCLLGAAVGPHIRAIVQDELWNNSYSNRLTIDWPGARPAGPQHAKLRDANTTMKESLIDAS